ncbi:MAG: hypothetical protein K0U34_04995 [Alphaproteobacteria bacterium]|nr:hypothetical protein [Alphaproteobacteria bacterium]
MKAIRKALGLSAIALLMPLTAGTATAAQVPDGAAKSATVAAAKTSGPSGLVTKSPEPKTIKVAGRRGRGLALGIIAGAATAAILSGAARGHDRYYYRSYRRSRYPRYRRHRHRCDRWAYKCDYGNDRACYKYDRYCY